MSHRSPLAFAGVLIILLLAVMGFAAFSTTPIETAQTAEGVVLPPTASGRIAGTVFATGLATSATSAPATSAPTEPAPVATAATAPTTTTTLPPTTTTTTTTPPTTTTTAPPPTTTTTAPPPPTTTTAPPPTTTTTAPPPTTTTTPPPESTEHPPAVEQWRGLVETYWPEELVEEALSVIYCESRGNPLAVNPSSSASGLFQFLPSTWATASPRAGWDGADVFDPEANIAVASWLYAQFTEPWQQWSCKP